jgi:hypothetical protein
MTKPQLSLFYGLTVLLACFFLVYPVYGEEMTSPTVEDAAVCLDIVDRACIDPNNVFPAQVARLFCFSRVLGAQEEIQVTHVWFFGDIERARVPLQVRSINYRTYSSKIIQPHEIGPWHVDILGPDDTLLKTVKFDIVE